MALTLQWLSELETAEHILEHIYKRGQEILNQEQVSDETGSLLSHFEPPRWWGDCLSLLRQDDSRELRQ